MYPKPLNAEMVVRKMGTGVETGVVFEHVRDHVGPAKAGRYDRSAKPDATYPAGIHS